MPDKPSGSRTPSVADFQRNLDNTINGARQDVRMKVAAAQSSHAARGLAISGSMLSAAVEIANDIHRNCVVQAMILINEFLHSNSQLTIEEMVITARGRFENFAATLLNSVPSAGMPQQAVKLQNQYAAVFQQRLDGALRDIEIGFVEGRRLNVVHNLEGTNVLDDMLEDRVTLVKNDGRIEREEIPSLVMKGKVQIHDSSLPIEVGDHLLRIFQMGLSKITLSMIQCSIRG